MMDPMQFLGVMQQMQQQMRQMQHQAHEAREAQTQQGAPPSGGSERQSQQLIMKEFDKHRSVPGWRGTVAELVLEDQDCCAGVE